MTDKLIVSAPVRRSIGAQVKWLLKKNVTKETVENWVRGLYVHMASLVEIPGRFPLDRDLTRSRGYEVRKSTFGEFVIFFRLIENRGIVEVVRLRHGARRP